MKPTFYITTAIFYSNSSLHIGHAHEVVGADAMARYKRLRGYDVKFLTGMDEHGQKIENAAAEQGISPQELVDSVACCTEALLKNLHISHDDFWRTTSPAHKAVVKKIFNKLYEQGDIYKASYKGLYCTPCEAFYVARQLLSDNRCPVCERAVELIDEEAYFFKQSNYAQRLIKHIEENPEFIQPVSRANEMLNNFLRPGLEDLCVSRTSFKWGIPVDFDPDHVVYVWIDALSNYVNALGFMSDDDSEYKKYWPADIHVIGKDIVRFHTIIWPAILMALGEPLPKQVFGHGWVNIDNKKIGKSLGNAIDPNSLIEEYGVDTIRYFLLREISWGSDGNFSIEALISRTNSDLANDLGNLLSRTVGMVDKYFGGTLPASQRDTDFCGELKEQATKSFEAAQAHYDRMEFDQALNEIWNMIRRANKYIDQVEPWKLTKEEDKQDMLAGSLYALVEVLRIAAILVEPVMPNVPAKIYTQLNITDNTSWDDAGKFALTPLEAHVTKGEAMFPRIDTK